MEPTQTPQQPSYQPHPSNKKFIIPLVILGILTLGLGGWVIYDQITLADKSDDCTTAESNENTDSSTASQKISEAAFQNDQSLYPNNTISSSNLTAIGAINSRYPEYASISEPMWLLGSYLSRSDKTTLSGSELFNQVASDSDLYYLLTELFGDYDWLLQTRTDNTLSAIFDVSPEVIQKALLAQYFTLENGVYTNDLTGLGGDAFPITFLTSITKTDQSIILDYNYAEVTGNGNDYSVTHQLRATLVSNGETEIQIKSLELID